MASTEIKNAGETKQNPSVVSTKERANFTRIPMSVPMQKMEVPDIPGFHMHWFLGSPDRIARAIQGGYEFVKPEEVHLNNLGLGDDKLKTGNTDLGDKVSVVAGGMGIDGQATRLYLMKIREEWWKEDQQLLAKRNSAVVDALTQGMTGAAGSGDAVPTHGAGTSERYTDVAQRYLDRQRTKIPDLFRRKS